MAINTNVDNKLTTSKQAKSALTLRDNKISELKGNLVDLESTKKDVFNHTNIFYMDNVVQSDWAENGEIKHDSTSLGLTIPIYTNRATDYISCTFNGNTINGYKVIENCYTEDITFLGSNYNQKSPTVFRIIMGIKYKVGKLFEGASHVLLKKKQLCQMMDQDPVSSFSYVKEGGILFV